ncbi:MAG: 1-acyl-sn-glycerol-3-phosphate acyltransferase [Campylobacterota bacterium]|nr:1-acyl-sn-glycerol-3-phosphate acyltransferase [Campylobacterota bacterium]
MRYEESIYLTEIEKRLLCLSKFVKEVTVKKREAEVIAFIYPDFQALKEQKIVNIENEIRWYAVELYNLDPIDDIKLDGYRIVQEPFSLAIEKEERNKASISEPKDEMYQQIKSYLQGVTAQPILPTSHLELDLKLDSLDYVMLFAFVEKSFAVYMDEALFAERMVMQDFCRYIAQKQQKSDIHRVSWSEFIEEPVEYALAYSPLWMTFYKTFFLPLFKLYFRLDISGEENLPESPCIIAPSHQSMLDGFILAASLPYAVLKRSFFLAYEGEFGKSFMRPVARNGQLIMINTNRNLKTSMQRTAVPLKEGENIIIFPEGARSRDAKLLPFKRYYAILAKELNLPIVPVLLDGTFEAMKAGKLFPRPAEVRVEYLSPVYPDELSYEEINGRVKSAIAEAMQKHPLRHIEGASSEEE